jgi:AcrR family transcriptional regulator
VLKKTSGQSSAITKADKSPEKGYHHGDLKEALIQASRKILSESGADALSLRAIAAEVGVSHMAPYSHFKNKKELFHIIAASGFDEMANQMITNTASITTAPELILAYGTTYIEFAIEQPQLYRLMLGQVENVGRRHQSEKINISLAKHEISSELDRSSKRPFDLLANAFAMTSPDELVVKAQALGAWSMVHGMAALLIEGHFNIPESMSVKEFLSMAAIQPIR